MMPRDRKSGRRPPGEETPADGASAGYSIPRKPARDKIMDFIARRDHSELELRQKLSRDYTQEETENAIEYARENGWLPAPAAVAERVVHSLNRKKKGHRFINEFLRNKGLPAVCKDSGEEVRKARAIIEGKLAKSGPFDYEEKKKIRRLLANRGFDDEIIRQVTGDAELEP